MNIVFLDAATLGDDIDLSPITSLGLATVNAATPVDAVPECIKDADVVVVNKIKLGENNLTRAKNLKLICVTATGYDNIDTEYCRSNGIAVCNIPGYSTDSVAQLTVAMVLELYGKLSDYREFVHSGEYSKSNTANRLTPVWNEISGKVWGIVGGGAIGGKVAKIADAFGCKVIVCRQKTDPVYETVDIDTLCEKADIISLHVPLTDKTREIINVERISKMKRNAIVINVARGAVTDEKALAQAMKENRLGGIGIDVYSCEPMPQDHPFADLLENKNVILTPHTAWGSFEARTRCITEVANNITSFISGKTKNRIV